MVNTYDETFVLRPRDCDLHEKWRPSAILETMQDVAGAHSILLGCGRDTALMIVRTEYSVRVVQQ